MHRSAILAGAVASALLAPACVLAQQAPTTPESARAEVKRVESVVVTASPLDAAATEMTQPATVLTEEDLRRRRAASLGDTLSGEPGVHSSAFGAGAGRPIIRGLDGPRIRVLENGIGSMDVSTISPDHAVTVETLNARQVEILRGPASLLYGSGAVGGVVNVVSDLVPRERAEAPGGAVEARAASGNDERTLSAKLDGGGGEVAVHLEAFTRRTGDYRIPGHAVRDDPESPSGRLPGSDTDSRGGGAGASWVGGRGFLGVGASTLRSDYGVPTAEGTRIALEQTRGEAAGELDRPFGGITRARYRLGYNDYEHREIESTGEVATTFLNKAWEGRLELAHEPWTDGRGALGFQGQARDFSALGEEAIIPETKASAAALFLVEQKRWGAWTVDGGARVERETRRPASSSGLPDRDFTLGSFAAGAVWSYAPGLGLSVNATRSERAPAIEELYTNGAHHATETFEIGDPNLRKEVSRGVEVMFRRTEGAVQWKVSAFASRVRDYVYAASVDEDGDGIADRVDPEGAPDPAGELLVQRYTQAEARFHGAEVEWRYRPEPGAWAVRLFADFVRGRLAGGENLPRMSPGRIGAEAEGRWNAWGARLTAMRVASQDRTAPLESATPGYTKVDAEVTLALGGGRRGLVAFLQGSNLLDEEIRVHTSYLKDVAPQMGRSFALGVRGEF